MKTKIKNAIKVNYKGKDYIVITYVVEEKIGTPLEMTLWVPITFIRGL